MRRSVAHERVYHDATQDKTARIRTNRCAAYPGWPVSALGSVPPSREWCRKESREVFVGDDYR